MHIKPDITLTLTRDDFDGYRLTTQTAFGASFISAHLKDYSPQCSLPVTEARKFAEKAKRCSLVVAFSDSHLEVHTLPIWNRSRGGPVRDLGMIGFGSCGRAAPGEPQIGLPV